MGRRGVHHPWIKIRFLPDLEAYVKEQLFLWITQQKKPVPFKVLERELGGEGILWVRLEGITTPERAQPLMQEKVFALEDDLRAFYQERPVVPASLLLDYQIVDAEGKNIGLVEEVRFTGQGRTFLITSNGKTLIPLDPGIIARIDHQARRIVLKLRKEDLEA